jgi:hypothetical protein
MAALPYGEDGQKAARTARFVNDQYAELVPLLEMKTILM